ncbi:purine-cytosine permease family protein [Rhodopila sp.]|uniref:purine-cytosine permease family protein n=1 Tax=Rhodopila sp. TaxID=2480087 RepID=UPI003D0EC986
MSLRSLYVQFLRHEDVEDYSLRYAPSSFRKWTPRMVASAGLGGTAALFPFAISAVMVNQYGSHDALIGNLIASAFCVLTGIPIANAIARYNLDMDLLTRGAGFGYFGSTITSLIFATFTFIFFAFEGAIMAQGITGTFGVPIRLSYVIVSVGVLPLVAFGMSFLAKFQTWTWPLWLLLLAAPLAYVAIGAHHGVGAWLSYQGMPTGPTHVRGGATGVNAAAIGLIAAALTSGLAQIGEQADYVRFMPDKDDGNRAWYVFWTFLSGPGWAVLFVVTFSLGAYLASWSAPAIGVRSDEPFQSFLYAYDQFLPHWLGLSCAFLLVVCAQAKINVTNAYSGSLSWSNFFSRVLHRHYGRFTWLILQVAIGLGLMEANIFKEMDALLGFYSNVAVAWISAVFADLFINRRLLRIGPDWIEFRRGYLYDFNPVGFGSMIVASVVAVAAYFGAFGTVLANYSPFVAAGLAMVLVPIVAVATRGRFYIKRMPEAERMGNTAGSARQVCVRCEDAFEPFDTVSCPFHRGTICSLCCTVESACHDVCKA